MIYVFYSFQVFKSKVEGNIFTSVVEKEGFIILGTTEGFVHKLSIHNGQNVLKISLGSRLVSTPLILDFEQLFNERYRTSDTKSRRKVIFIASSKGIIDILDFDTGCKMTSITLPGEIFSSPSVLNNRIVIGCRDNHVYGLELQIGHEVT